MTEVKESGCSAAQKDCGSSCGVCCISLIIMGIVFMLTNPITPCPAGKYAKDTGPDVKRYTCLPCEENCALCQDVTGKCYDCIDTHKLDDDKNCIPACTGNKPGKWNARTDQCDCKNSLVTLGDSCIQSCPAEISYDEDKNACNCADGFKVGPGPNYKCISICEKENYVYNSRFKKCVCGGILVGEDDDEKCLLYCGDG